MCYSELYARSIYDVAKKKNPKATEVLEEIYRSTDMPHKEFVEHLRIIAFRDR